MPGPAPKTDKWTARENKQGKLGIVLIVSGLVQVSNTSKQPRLKEAGAGGKAKTLVLDLSIETGAGPGNEVLVWKRATFSKDVSAGQYDGVEIRWDGKTIASCEVRDDEEHHLHLVALTQAANRAQGKAKRPAPAKPKPRAGAKKPAAAKKPGAAKKRPPAAKKRKSAAAKKRAPAAKKRRSATARTRGPASAKKRRAASVKKRAASAKKRRPAFAKKRRPASRKR